MHLPIYFDPSELERLNRSCLNVGPPAAQHSNNSGSMYAACQGRGGEGGGGWDSISITSNWGLVKTSLICPIDSVTPPTIAIFFRYRIFVDISALFCLWYSSLDTACIARNVTLYFSYIQQHNRLRITTITYFCVWKRWIPANTYCIAFVQCWTNVVQIISKYFLFAGMCLYWSCDTQLINMIVNAL